MSNSPGNRSSTKHSSADPSAVDKGRWSSRLEGGQMAARMISTASVIWYRWISQLRMSSAVSGGGAEYLEAMVCTARSARSGETKRGATAGMSAFFAADRQHTIATGDRYAIASRSGSLGGVHHEPGRASEHRKATTVETGFRRLWECRGLNRCGCHADRERARRATRFCRTGP